MGVTLGMPSMKLNNVGNRSKSCGGFEEVADEGLDRNGKDLDIDPSRADRNEYIGYQTAEELIAYSNRHIEEMNASLRAQGKRCIRSDAVVMCSTIIKPPAHWMNALSEQDRKRFMSDAIEGIKQIIPPENIKSIAIHRDERGDHAHVFWEPMTPDGRLSAKECHNLKFFGKLNREMPAFLRDRGWDIDDCKSYDAVEEQKIREDLGEEKYAEYKQEQRRNRGVDSIKFKHEAETELKELKQEIDTLKLERSSVLATVNRLRRMQEEGTKSLQNAEEHYMEKPFGKGVKIIFKNPTDWENVKESLKIAKGLENGYIQGTRNLKSKIEEYEELKSQALEEQTKAQSKSISALYATDQATKAKKEYETLYARQQVLNDINRQLEEENKALHATVSALEGENASLKAQINNMWEKTEKRIKSAVTALEGHVQDLEERLSRVASTLANCIRAVNMLRFDAQYGFKVQLTRKQDDLLGAVMQSAHTRIIEDLPQNKADALTRSIEREIGVAPEVGEYLSPETFKEHENKAKPKSNQKEITRNRTRGIDELER